MTLADLDRAGIPYRLDGTTVYADKKYAIIDGELISFIDMLNKVKPVRVHADIDRRKKKS